MTKVGKTFIVLIACQILSFHLCAQDRINTENNLGIEELVKDVFIKGNCRNVTNITALGDQSISIGQFENGESSINIKDGIILSTGDIKLAHGPNITSEASYSLNTMSDDFDLGELATSDLFDVTGIEFDFVPLDDVVSFRYVFASEEYCEFVGTSFNDVFGFFVSGPGINGPYDNNAINVAKLLTTNQDVSINNVNHLDNTNFYVSNVTNLDAEACEINHTQEFEEFIEYDGFTIPLTATFTVVPCETYHIRLVIGDVGDPNLDSAVFLETNSFDLGQKVTVRAEVIGSDAPVAYESCIDGQFVFTRNDASSLNQACTIEYTISPESEAVNGVDFVEIPMSVTIPAGEPNFILPITVLEDNIIEGPEVLKLQFEYNCDCIDASQTELIINEAGELTTNFDAIAVCANQQFSISPEVIGGVPPLDFLWNTGATTEILETTATTSTQYMVTITDFCDNTGIGIADVEIQNQPTATLVGTYDLCETITTGIPVQFEGNPSWEVEYTIDGIVQAPFENIQTNPFYLSTSKEGTYVLTSFKDAYCEGSVINSAIVEYTTFNVETEIVSPSCVNRADGSITITELDAIEPFSVDWNIPTSDDYFLDELPADAYTLQITDGNGCVYEEVFELSAVTEDLKLCVPYYIPNIFSPNNDGFNDIFSIFIDNSEGIESVISMEIYDRWGSLIFEQTNFTPNNSATIGWKGDYRGKPVDLGIYVYKILLAFADGSTQLVSGDIMVLR